MVPISFTWAGEREVHLKLPADRVLHAYHVLRSSGVKGIVEVTPGSRTVQLRLAQHGEAEPTLATVRSLLERVDAEQLVHSAALVEIPICSDTDLAPDLDWLAERAGVSAESAADLHAEGKYTVKMLGFSPGFAYLTGLPGPLHAPRLPTPRPRVRPGSVGIANAQVGLYPQASPGGWRIIGATPLRLFQPDRDRPTLLAPGDRVRFRRITRAEFDETLAGRA